MITTREGRSGCLGAALAGTATSMDNANRSATTLRQDTGETPLSTTFLQVRRGLSYLIYQPEVNGRLSTRDLYQQQLAALPLVGEVRPSGCVVVVTWRLLDPERVRLNVDQEHVRAERLRG